MPRKRSDREREARRKAYKAFVARNPSYAVSKKTRWMKRYPLKAKNRAMLTKYGITLKQIAQMKKVQDHKCAICRKKKKLCIDHSHLTLKVRGLLCNKCNWAIGHLSDDPNLCDSAAFYLRNEGWLTKK